MAGDVAYLMGVDHGPNRFYAEAALYFTTGRKARVVTPTAPAKFLSLADVFADLAKQAGKTPPVLYDTVHIVSHANAFGGLQFPLDTANAATADPYVSEGLLRRVLGAKDQADSGLLKPLSSPAVTAATTIQIDGCDIGRDTTFLTLFGQMFGQPARVRASKRVVMFRHAGSDTHMALFRTWTVVWKPADLPRNAGDWAAFRTTFLDAVGMKFAVRFPEAPLPQDEARRPVEPVATGATFDASLPAFFFMESISVAVSHDPDKVDAKLQAYVRSLKSAALEGPDVDDTTVASTFRTADFQPLVRTTLADGAVQVEGTATTVALAALWVADAKPGDPTHFTEVAFGPARNPSAGPSASLDPDFRVRIGMADASDAPTPDRPAPEPVGAPGAGDALAALRDAIVAAGGDPAGLDALVARALPPPDGTDVVVALDAPALSEAAWGPDDITAAPASRLA